LPKSHLHRNPERENDVLKLHKAGKTVKEIAEALKVTVGTAGYYLYKNHIYKDPNHMKSHKNHHNKNGKGTNENGKHISSTKNSNHATVPPGVEIQQAHAAGRLEEILRGYATSSGVPFGLFAIGVAESLHASARRELLRMSHPMSALRGKAAA
jgi:hypothetical protein